MAVSGSIASRYVLESLALAITGVFFPMTVIGAVFLRKRNESDPQFKVLRTGVAALLVMVGVPWIAFDLGVPLGLSLSFGQLDVAIYFSAGVLIVDWGLIRLLRRRSKRASAGQAKLFNSAQGQ